ncbi:hypothetical protein ACHAXT_012527 [Thalassiosira profunda]
MDSPGRDDDSLLSALSPQPSCETDDAQYDKLELSWTDGSALDGDGGSRDFGQEVTVVDPETVDTQEVLRDLMAATPKAGSARMHDATPKAGSMRRRVISPKVGSIRNYNDSTPRAGPVSAFEPTPRAGTAKRNAGSTERAGGKPHISTASDDHFQDDPDLATPSWDIDRAFSFRNRKDGQSAFSGIWDFVSTIGSNITGSHSHEEDATEGGDDGDDAPNVSPRTSEAQENDMFAMEVGLLFSQDEGDTINDPSALSQNFSSSFTIESETSVDHPAAYDLDQYNLKHNHTDMATDATTKGDDSTIHTAGQNSVRDGHGNQVPENAKMILGYHVAKERMTSRQQREQINNAFPTVKTTDTAPEEMERRLRELAGQISSDWRDSDFMPPALARRLRDFQFAREKRRKKYGNAKPWCIIGLYDHLSGVKIDVAWAEDAAWRRQNKQPYLTWSDYEASKNEGRNRPFFTYLIVAACTAMMVAALALNGWRFEPVSVNPMIGPSAETLLRLGAKDSYLIVMENEIWRLASPMVLHAGLIHFFLNMFALWFVGKAVEQIHGFFPAVIQFVVPAVGGIILSAIFLPEYITVGASGAIFGLIGACLSDILMNWHLLFNEFVNERGARLSHAKVLLVLVLDIVVNCLIGLTPYVDNFTHLGGMLYGFLCGLSTIQLVSPRFFGDNRQCLHKCKLFCFRSFGLLVCVAGVLASSIVLFSGDGATNPCPTCTKLSCFSFPPWAEPNEKWWYCDDCSRASAEGTLDTESGMFTSLNLRCPNGPMQTVDVEEAWPQDEVGLEGILPELCREHCLF